MQTLQVKQMRQIATRYLEEGASYDDLDNLCKTDITQNRIASVNLTRLLESIYIATGKIPVFGETGVTFENTDYPASSTLPSFLRFRDCPVASIPGHKRDREIFQSFYPILDENMGLYFRVALAWLRENKTSHVPVMLHLSNRDFDSMRRLKIYVPVITNMDTRMDIVAISSEAFLKMLITHNDGSQPRFYRFDPRSGARSPTITNELLPTAAIEQVEHIRNEQYPAFYERMLDYVKERRNSTGAYTAGQFLLDLQMRN